MTIEEFYEAAKALIPNNKLQVNINYGEPFGWLASVVLVNGSSYNTLCGGDTPMEALEKIPKAMEEREHRKANRIAALKAELAELEQ